MKKIWIGIVWIVLGTGTYAQENAQNDLRPSRLESDAIRSSLDLAMSHFGKKYDFDFNVNTTETIVCSELVYAA